MDQSLTDLKKLIETKNVDLPERMRREDWRVFYDRKADLLVLSGTMTDDSEYVTLNEDGLMVRLDDGTGKIQGFAIENFRIFSRKNSEFRLICLPLTDPMLYFLLVIPVLLAVRTLDAFSSVKQRDEITEYVSKEIMFGAVAI